MEIEGTALTTFEVAPDGSILTLSTGSGFEVSFTLPPAMLATPGEAAREGAAPPTARRARTSFNLQRHQWEAKK